MKEKFLDYTINYLKKYNNYSKDEIKKLRYGLEGIYLTLTKTIVILLVSLILGILMEVVIGLILFNIIRYFAFGFHAEKSFECLLLSLFNFVLIPYILLNTSFNLITNETICAICFILILLFAPADTVKRPLKSKKKRVIRKILTCITGIIYITLAIIFNNHFISDLLISSLISTSIVICPITYMIFRQPYNNYKKIS